MEEKKESKKTISSRTAVKGLINGFVAYGVLIIFIFLAVTGLISWAVNNIKDTINYNVLKYSLPLIAAFVLFFLIRGVCRLSTFDLFKKCKIEKQDVETVSSKMNLFFILCVMFFVFLIIFTLFIRFNNQLKIIQNESDSYYSSFTEDYANYLSDKAYTEFEEQKNDTIIQTVIIECGLLFGLFSLIPTQKKLIEIYNEK
jgi:hypothetical protein